MNIEDTVCCDLSDFNFPTKEEIKASIKPKQHRAINEYTIDGEYLNTYDSIAKASKAFGASCNRVADCAYGRNLTCSSLSRIFLFREDDIEKRLLAIDEAKKKWKTGMDRQIDEYDLRGRFLFTYPTQKMAAAANKVSSIAVGQCCRGEKPYIRKRIFLHYGDNIKDRMPAVKEALHYEMTRRRKCRPVDVYTLDGQYIKGFPSASAASREYGIHVSEITRCCHGIDGDRAIKLTAHGKIFLFTGGSISERLKSINDLKK